MFKRNNFTLLFIKDVSEHQLNVEMNVDVLSKNRGLGVNLLDCSDR